MELNSVASTKLAGDISGVVPVEHLWNPFGPEAVANPGQAMLPFEPGIDTTIQTYAGIGGSDNLQPNSEAMFHSFSIDQIREHIKTGPAGAVAGIVDTNNEAPSWRA